MNSKFILLSIALLMPLYLAQDISIEKLLAYNKWSSQNLRNFLNDEEKLFRQLVFFENLQKVKDHNSQDYHTYSLALNQFSDMTEEEFVEKVLMKSDFVDLHIQQATSNNSTTSTIEESTSSNSTSDNAAVTVDWRTKGAVTSVKNQGQCGSCWTFSAAGLMESFNFIKNKNLTNFSEQQLVDCVNFANGYSSNGCNGGNPTQCLDYSSKFGITTLQNYPYVGVQKKCNITGTNNGFKPQSWKKIPNTSKDLQNALNFSPVSVVVDASTWSHYKSGVYNGCNQTKIRLNHAVLAVGYDSVGNWIVKNSWGTGWGEEGYIRLSPNNTCGILSYNNQITA
ncbi:papain family cysteine protease (macronuclear) [Tetrahymena thermophila SB210]|uniref:Papain family cysteine protease n=1 Tax=Tetrahymena thermophila (strain SB210) TaxID=312017 RepID=I7MFG4_TETTS|nr:papain family cysteine protease [Tetrahymena thermophila SB210]EAR99856.1 papain family cysteine protease [Tetrahymena thermophila SB210]|eukprot:XP_001020101.1 papain family cysteine protease [Tetrahymena thermophila SB210]